MYKFKDGNMKVPAFIWADDVDHETLQQIRNLCDLPVAFHHVSLMPDGHLGYGMPIGGVLATKDVVIPNAVGVDIGCGVTSCKLPIKEITREQVQAARKKIKEVVPSGFKHQKKSIYASKMPKLSEDMEGSIVHEEYFNAIKQLGTLGGGNHFIEIQRGSDGYIYLMVHSGSRNLGLKVAKYYHNLAIKTMEQYHVKVPKDLSFLPTSSTEGVNYLREMQYCVDFASVNRQIMMQRCIEIMEEICGFSDNDLDIKDVPHNYARLENHYGKNVWVHRKGATSAYEGQTGLIPGDMGSSSYIVEGLGNPESFKSCSHGAGRTMSRVKAKETLDLKVEQEKLDSLGIVHDIRSVGKLDEAPGSYKDIEAVMDNQKDLVKIKTVLIPLGSIKG